jgi:hypothetical protein
MFQLALLLFSEYISIFRRNKIELGTGKFENKIIGVERVNAWSIIATNIIPPHDVMLRHGGSFISHRQPM